ncbi:helix-turn-helix transcriptional regulator [Plantactinospora siamensis]|uniref:Helix-turn-helix transcriptional regulator n=1 Tax=Plantactinospora siamensis TaxID=555372 RepID=A0ABV6P5S7_9ACTN
MAMSESGSTARLGEFLRARRALVRPESHGIPTGTRRTPGLRREEVAMLAGVSIDYYVRLEQGRERHPSDHVLNALARTLRLADEATAYLHGLAAAGASGRRRSDGADTAADGLISLMNAWPDTPALLYGRRLDLLAANALGAALFSWIGAETNLLRAIFLRPEARVFYREWAVIAEGCVAALRAENPDPGDPRLVELVETLAPRSPDFARLWARQEVRAKRATVKHLEHAEVGRLSMRFENLTVADAPGQHLVVYHAERGSPEDRAIDRLRARP